jgi:hypothetical protein
MHVTETTCSLKENIMNSQYKRGYLEAIYLRDKRVCRKGKAVILDEFCATCGYQGVDSTYRDESFRQVRKDCGEFQWIS